jgi:hypothetical protein
MGAAALAIAVVGLAVEQSDVNPGAPAANAGAARQTPANVVVLMTDDETVEDMDVMPRTRELLGSNGVTFARSYVSYPVCCPSRATYLTGQYAHNHGVMGLYPPTGGPAASTAGTRSPSGSSTLATRRPTSASTSTATAARSLPTYPPAGPTGTEPSTGRPIACGATR